MIKSLSQSIFSRSKFSRSKMGAKVLLQRFMSSSCAIEGNFVHPCVIQGKQSLVHAADLESRDQAFYQQLEQYALDNDYVLVADRRSEDSPDVGGRRKSWLLVMTLSVGLNTAVAADDYASHGHDSTSHASSLGLFEPSAIEQMLHQPEPDTSAESSSDIRFDYQFIDTPESQQIEAILLNHLVDVADAPDYIRTDVEQMARYFSQYPQVVSLIQSLADTTWKLHYQENTFATEVRGNAFQVQAVNIRFDSRAAAQLRSHNACETKENANACIASPADALLHELLHARSALLDTKRFISQGGLSSVLYPYAHEHEVIQHERKLYREMSSQDGISRPQRNKHSGRLVASSCTVCIN